MTMLSFNKKLGTGEEKSLKCRELLNKSSGDLEAALLFLNCSSLFNVREGDTAGGQEVQAKIPVESETPSGQCLILKLSCLETLVCGCVCEREKSCQTRLQIYQSETTFPLNTEELLFYDVNKEGPG